MSRLSTILDVVAEITAALGEHASAYDVSVIARDAYAYCVDVNDQGQALANTAGFECVVSDDEFWRIVERHVIPSALTSNGDTR